MCENGPAVTSDDRPRRSLADDPNFIDSLTDLDHGVIEQDQRVKRPVRPAAATSQPTSHDTPDVPVVPLFPRREEDPQRPRRFLDLFPSGGDINTALTASPAAQPAVEPERPSLEPRFRERRSADRAKPSGYEQFYGLEEPPFSLAADPRYLYHSQSHDRAAQAVLDAIRNREGIVLLTGAVGLGKTLLCRAVLEELDRRTLTSYVTDPSMSPQELLKTILVDFGVISHADRATGRLAHASVADLQAALRDFLYTLAPIHAFAVVILDDAHGLSIELLRHVGVLAESGGGERLLQVILVGQPTLINTVTKTSLRPIFQQASTHATLTPLEPEEVEDYVNHRLNVGGRNARVAFDRSAIAELQTLSQGVPRMINLLCDRALLEGAQQSAGVIGEPLVRRAAEHLDLVPQHAAVSTASRFVGITIFFALLMIVGAAAGAYFYRSEVAALIQRWEERPAAPPPPPLEKPEPIVAPSLPANPAQ